MAIDNVLASVAVKDLAIAERWYGALLGRAGSKPMPEVIEWKFPGGRGLRTRRTGRTLLVHSGRSTSRAR